MYYLRSLHCAIEPNCELFERQGGYSLKREDFKKYLDSQAFYYYLRLLAVSNRLTINFEKIDWERWPSWLKALAC